MSKLDDLLKATVRDSQRTLSELVNKIIEENRVTFNGITETLTVSVSDDVVVV